MAKNPFKIQSVGTDELRRDLSSFPDELRAAAVDGLSETAEAIKERQRDAVPVDEGDLEDSIGIEINERSLTAFIGPRGEDVYYSQFVEFGTSSQAARPFITPSAEHARTDFPARLAQALNRLLRK